MHLQDYSSFDAVDLAALIRQGHVSADEIAAAARSAIARANPRLNAVVAEADSGIPKPGGDPAPFFGVPFLVKDLGHGWSGIPASMSSRIGRGYGFTSDGPLAQRFRAGGLRVVGVSASSEFGMNAVTESFLHGPTRNPWDDQLSPGGSSGGAAAAVAAGIVPIAHATDGGGSIRQPAAWCGLVGLKPSRGRNPFGSSQASDGTGWVIAHHVVSRTLRDTAAALDITCGPLPGDFVALPKPSVPFLDHVTREPRALRIGLCTRWSEAPAPDGACVDAALEAGRLLEQLGHTVDVVTPAISFPEMVTNCFDLFLHGAAEGIRAVSAATGIEPGADSLEPPALAMLDLARRRSGEELRNALHTMVRMSRIMADLHQRYDVLLTPAVSQLPCPVGLYNAKRYSPTEGEFWDVESVLYAFSPLASITGQPALVLPFFVPETPLPVGIQLMAANGADALLFELGGQIERARPWAGRLPPLHVAAG